MTNEELLKLGKTEILKTYKQLYIERFRAVFGYEPKCASCSFSSDFKKFRNKILNFKENIKVMKTENKKYILKKGFSSNILSYVEKGKVVRIFGREMNDEFAEAFLKNGSKKQLEDRKSMFLNLKEDSKEVAKEVNDEPTEKVEDSEQVLKPKAKRNKKKK